MKITKKQIKEGTTSIELENNGRFRRSFEHCFVFRPDRSEGKKFHKIEFSLINEQILITIYGNRLNDEPKEEELHTYEGKAGFVNEVYDYINSL